MHRSCLNTIRLALLAFLAILLLALSNAAYANNIACPTARDIDLGKTKCAVGADKAPNVKSEKPMLKLAETAELKDVIAIALERHPQILAARARVRESAAGIDVAKSNGRFQLEGSYGAGYGGASETLDPLSSTLLDKDHLAKQLRNELTLSGKQLIYDFGATESGILRAVTLKTSETYNLQEKIEEIALNVADAYMRVVEARKLSHLNRDNIAALEKVQALVIANQANGNGTIADVKRVEARLVDAKAVAADTEADLQNAIDRFRRLVKEDPAKLTKTPVLMPFMPKTASLAIEMLPHSSVHLLAIDASIRGIQLELKAKKQINMPQLVLMTDAITKAYSGKKYKNDLDVRAMLTLTYKFMDGGLADAQLGQILARLAQEEQRYQFDRDEAEADLRQLFNAIDAARGKSKELAQGVDASAKARELYTEQFRGGKRTLFELLDIQTAFFTASRNKIMNHFEEQRSSYSVLKTLGLFTQVILHGHASEPEDDFITNSPRPDVMPDAVPVHEFPE